MCFDHCWARVIEFSSFAHNCVLWKISQMRVNRLELSHPESRRQPDCKLWGFVWKEPRNKCLRRQHQMMNSRRPIWITTESCSNLLIINSAKYKPKLFKNSQRSTSMAKLLQLKMKVNLRRCYTRQFFMQLDSQRLKAQHSCCANRRVTLCNGTASNSRNCDRGGPRRG